MANLDIPEIQRLLRMRKPTKKSIETLERILKDLDKWRGQHIVVDRVTFEQVLRAANHVQTAVDLLKARRDGE